MTKKKLFVTLKDHTFILLIKIIVCIYIYGYDVFSHSKYWIIDVFLPILGSAQLCCVGFLLNTFMAVLLTMTKFQGWERYSVCVCVKNILVLFTVVSQLWSCDACSAVFLVLDCYLINFPTRKIRLYCVLLMLSNVHLKTVPMFIFHTCDIMVNCQNTSEMSKLTIFILCAI